MVKLENWEKAKHLVWYYWWQLMSKLRSTLLKQTNYNKHVYLWFLILFFVDVDVFVGAFDLLTLLYSLI